MQVLAYFGAVPVPTPTHGQALVGALLLVLCLPLLTLVAGGVARWWRRAEEFVQGVCGRCGYSLRGLPAGTVCPECGADTRVVGTRRPVRRWWGGGARLACVLWVGLLIGVNLAWGFEIECYVLRLVWGIESAPYLGLPPDYPTAVIRRIATGALAAGGIGAILWFSRRRRAGAGR